LDKGTLLLLLEKFRQGTCSPEEAALLHTWLDALEQDDALPAISPDQLQQVKEDMQRRIWPDPAIRPRRIGLPVKIAAAVIPLVIAGYFLLRHLSKHAGPSPASIAWQTVSNNSRQLKKVVLPDNSVVLAGPYSTIQYPAQFPDNARPVRITEGKAFFDVTTDARPFTVEDNSGVRTTVLGTSFTVEASRSWQLLRVAVATGKVQVQRKGLTTAVLGPSQRITIRQQSIQQDSIATADLLAWTTGEIILRNANLQELLLTINNQYGITATTALNVHEGNYNLRIPASMTLQEVLDIVEKISYRPKIKFSMQHKQLIVH
jgi:ferric-dicitrate binding protein FerR (iron transport regulator)